MNSKAKNQISGQMSSPAGLAGYMNGAGMAMREKLWPERDADEKLAQIDEVER